jgi:hypothetical protein
MHEYTRYEEGQSTLRQGSPSPNGKWGISIGIHQGTITSRDTDETSWEHDSFQACQDALTQAIAYLTPRGCYIWFAEAIAPDGTRHKLTEGAPYQR